MDYLQSLNQFFDSAVNAKLKWGFFLETIKSKHDSLYDTYCFYLFTFILLMFFVLRIINDLFDTVVIKQNNKGSARVHVRLTKQTKTESIHCGNDNDNTSNFCRLNFYYDFGIFTKFAMLKAARSTLCTRYIFISLQKNNFI